MSEEKKEVKIKTNPVNWIQKFFEQKTEYDKYLEKGDFSLEAFNELLDKTNKNTRFSHIQHTVSLIRSMEWTIVRDDYTIEFQKNTGTYRLSIPTNLNSTSLHWVTNYICELFDINIQTDKDKQTFFVRNYDGGNYFHLSHLFDKVDDKIDYDTWLKYNVIPNPFEIEKDAKWIISKVNAFLKMIDSIVARIDGEIRLSKRIDK